MSTPITLVVRSGDVWTGRVPAGSTVLLSDGAAGVITGPARWLDGVMVTPRQRLSGGTAHIVEEAGWVQVEMRDPGRLGVLAPARRTRLARWLERWLGRRLAPAGPGVIGRGSRPRPGRAGSAVAPSLDRSPGARATP